MQFWKNSILLLLSAEAFAFRAQISPSSQQWVNRPRQIPSGPRPSIPWLKQSQRQSSERFVSTTIDQDGSDSQPNNAKTVSKTDEDTSLPDMPWSDLHAFALRDNLPKYTRILPGKTPNSYALWRTMMQDVPELSGYPIDFLREKCSSKEGDSAPDVLPFLDDFYFEPSGGLSGQVYGVPGLKGGTKIETSPVGQVEVTIPLGYVLTEDDGIAYELGKPLVTAAEEVYSLDGAARTATRTAGSLTKQATSTVIDALSQRRTVGTEEGPSSMLVGLGASTGLLLAGAAAISMLSHHLTVNVFWV